MLKMVMQKLVAGLFLVSIFGAYRAKAVDLSPLMTAVISHKKIEALKLIGEYTPDQINWQNTMKLAALDYAVMGGDIEIAAALINRGAEINKPGNSNFTPLQTAISFTSKQNRRKMVALLLAHGANPNATSCAIGTPFFSAVEKGDLGVLEALFAGKIKPNLSMKNILKISMLSYAIQDGKLPVVKCLVEHGADLTELKKINGELYYLDEWAEKFQKQAEIAKYLRPLRLERTDQKTNQNKRKQFDGGTSQQDVKKLKNNFGAVVPLVAGLNSGGEQKILKK